MSNYPLYDSTFISYRVSPLYHGNSPVLDNLDLHARRLRDKLKGDTFRSLQIAEGEAFGGASGDFKSCTWELFGDEASWQRHHPDDNEDEDEISMVGDVTTHEARGIHMQVEYEKANHHAVLLGNPAKKSTSLGFTSLPLLLIRMPVALRETLIQYLSTAFDVRVSPMKLRSGFLASTIEKIVDRNTSLQFIESGALNKGLQLQLSFPAVNPSLKSLDIALSKDDVEQFVSHGEALFQQYRRGVAAMRCVTRPQQTLKGPFSAALSAYLNQHLTLTLDNPAVVISKVVCGPFALAGEGRVKILRSSEKRIDFWEFLVKEAEGSGLAVKEDSDLQVSPPESADLSIVETAPMRRRIPTEPPPPYELYDPAASRQ